MPHMVLTHPVAWPEVAAQLTGEPRRWGRAVLKSEGRWLRLDGEGVLVEGLVVEFARPLHPVLLLAPHHGHAIVRLWPLVAVERSRAVQRWLCEVASELATLGAGPVTSTNIAPELWEDLPFPPSDQPATD